MTKGWFNTPQTKYIYMIYSIYVSCSNTTIQKLVVIYIWRHTEDKYSVGVFSLRSTALLKHFGRGKTMSSKSAVSFFGALHTVVLVLWFCWQLLPLSLWLQYQHNSRELVAAVRVCGFILRSVSGLSTNSHQSAVTELVTTLLPGFTFPCVRKTTDQLSPSFNEPASTTLNCISDLVLDE